MNKFKPAYVRNSIFELDEVFFEREHVSCLLLDIDNTLVPDNDPYPDEKVNAFIEKILSMNIKICLVSNNKKKRVEFFNSNLNLKAVCRARKPLPYKIRKAIRELSADKSETLLVGDQLLTDIWAGNNAGIRTMLVNPINVSKENNFFKLKRFIEKKVLMRNFE